MKTKWLWIIGIAAAAFFFLRKKPAAGAKSPVSNSGTAGARDSLSDWAANIKSIYSGANNPDNTPQLIDSASKALSSVWQGFNGLFKSSSASQIPRTDTSIGAGAVGPGAAVDFGSGVTSEDLGSSYDWGLGANDPWGWESIDSYSFEA